MNQKIILGSIKDLAEKVIDETAWEIDSESDFIFPNRKKKHLK